MNENIDLTKILKDCPNGFELYSSLCGTVLFRGIDCDDYPVKCECHDGKLMRLTKEGYFFNYYGAECLLFPSKDQRDWYKFTVPWYKKERFDPKTLQPFDKVLVRDNRKQKWQCNFFSCASDNEGYPYPYFAIGTGYSFCIPYNDDTKHLVSTTEEAPEYYRYWAE